MLIYKILTQTQWDDLQTRGETAGAPVDIADGFVHFSTAEQLRETAARHFAAQQDLWLLSYDVGELDGVAWEPSRGGALFPHLYAALPLAPVKAAIPLPLDAGRHVFPDEIP
ncbi:MAG: DUF952 domain-containing protein [Pseudomonadota bacterium]